MKFQTEKNRDYEVYILPEHWASALINDDRSGLDKQDIEEIQDFYKANRKDNHFFYCVTCTEEGFFTGSNDAFNLGCNCLEYTFDVSPLTNKIKTI